MNTQNQKQQSQRTQMGWSVVFQLQTGLKMEYRVFACMHFLFSMAVCAAIHKENVYAWQQYVRTRCTN